MIFLCPPHPTPNFLLESNLSPTRASNSVANVTLQTSLRVLSVVFGDGSLLFFYYFLRAATGL